MPGLDLSGLVPVIEDLVLLDTVRISTPAGAPVFDPATGTYTYPAGEVVYEGRGAVQSAMSVDAAASTPGSSLPWPTETRSRYRLLTPLSAPTAAKDTLVTVLSVHAGGDPALLGRRWRVQDPAASGTLGVIRVTLLDQITESGAS
ncbi:DUF6093 family protein [Streptomyces sp. Da 82-17]|uniref:DUF6093 family protein n=1 Tax=Streptomyces sp. Da 82-17 TaxID=3377116 RepID=UPI0038D418A1